LRYLESGAKLNEVGQNINILKRNSLEADLKILFEK
jgi:hypothetical protein